MPIAHNRTVELYWKSVGAGPAVLLIAGQAMTLEAWWRTVPRLARSFRVLRFDNRGVGRSSHWPWPYVVSQMADDAIAVLDAARVETAHIYGISLGGMVAQEIALRYPHRVSAVILGATMAGGPEATLAQPEALSFFIRAGAMAPEEAEWAAVPYSYSLRTRRRHGDRIAQDIARRVQNKTEMATYLHQVGAASVHNTSGRLGLIKAPTLIVHGDEDLIMPPENAYHLANEIPNAELKLWPDAAHLYTTDEPKADLYVRRFLEAHTAATRAVR